MKALLLWTLLAAFASCQTPEQELRLLEQAAEAAPLEPVPHLALATAYLERAEQEEFAQKAERELQLVLQMQPENVRVMEHLGHLYLTRAGAKQDEAEKEPLLREAAYWSNRILGLQPNNKAAHYNLGVVAWARFYPVLISARSKLGMTVEEPGPLRSAEVRADLRGRFGSMLDDGIRRLERALEIDLNYVDAIAALKLIYRARADLQDAPDAYKRNMAMADQLGQRATVSLPVGGVSRPARLLSKMAPVYPPRALELRLEGAVRYSGRVLKDGTLANLTLRSGHPLLVPAATEALRHYRYEPALDKGVPVEQQIEVQVDFVLP